MEEADLVKVIKVSPREIAWEKIITRLIQIESGAIFCAKFNVLSSSGGGFNQGHHGGGGFNQGHHGGGGHHQGHGGHY